MYILKSLTRDIRDSNYSVLVNKSIIQKDIAINSNR